jgi:hypothetical protein
VASREHASQSAPVALQQVKPPLRLEAALSERQAAPRAERLEFQLPEAASVAVARRVLSPSAPAARLQVLRSSEEQRLDVPGRVAPVWQARVDVPSAESPSAHHLAWQCATGQSSF